MAATDLQKIEKISRIVRPLAFIFAGLYPLIVLLFWLNPDVFPFLQSEMIHDLMGEEPIPPLKRALGFFVMMLPGGAFMFIFLKIVKLLDYFRQGKFLVQESVNALKSISLGFLFFGVLAILSRTLLSLAMTYDLAEGKKKLVIGFELEDFLAIGIGVVLLVFSHVWHMETKKAEESDLIV